MKKIISFSLWGDDPIYNIGAIRNAELSPEIYPDWICRFYLGDNVPKETEEKLKQFDHVELVKVDEKNDWLSTVWRFYAVDVEDGADVVIFRDTDSRLTHREYEAVEEWLTTGRYLHIMRDHPNHTDPISAGMWGCLVKDFIRKINQEVYVRYGMEEISNLKTILKDWLSNEKRRTENEEPNCYKLEDYTSKGIDQRFLRDFIFKMMFEDRHVHDDRIIDVNDVKKDSLSYYIKPFHSVLKPDEDGFYHFIGQVYDENDAPNEEYSKLYEENKIAKLKNKQNMTEAIGE